MSLQCNHMENPKNGHDLYYYHPDGTEAGFLCNPCAVAAGFCPRCGNFFDLESDAHLYIVSFGYCETCESTGFFDGGEQFELYDTHEDDARL